MRLIKYSLMACATAALLAGCSTTQEERDAQGRPDTTYEESRGSAIDGLNRGVNTNWFGPVNSGATGVGTPSGSFDHNQR